MKGCTTCRCDRAAVRGTGGAVATWPEHNQMTQAHSISSRVSVLIAATLALASMGSHVGRSQPAGPQPSICFVASHHELGSGGYRFLVEPRFKTELEDKGWSVGYAMLSALNEEKLATFNVVVLQQHPDVERFRLRGMFEHACALLQQYVEQGGGLFVFGDLHRGRIFGNLNQLLAPFGAEMLYQAVEETDASKVRPMANYRAVRGFLTDHIAPTSISAGVRTLWYPRFGQTTATFQTDENWTVAIRASSTARSRPLAESARSAQQPGYTQTPPLAACRTFRHGRVVLFSSHSSWYTLNPYHFMWDNGFFLNHGDARRFLLNSFQWLAAPSLQSGSSGGFTPDRQTWLFDIRPRLQESPRDTVTRALAGPRRIGVIGISTRYSGGTHGVDDFCRIAREIGLDYLVFAEQQTAMDEPSWQQLVSDCERNSDEAFVAIPGVRFRGRESGNDGIVFNLRKPWAELPWTGPGFDTFIRIGCKNAWQANQAQVLTGLNPLPYYNQGAVNCHTLFSYATDDSGHIQLTDDSRQTFADSNISGWRLAPITFHDLREPSQLRATANTFRTSFYSDKWGPDITPGSVSLLNTSVSNGPRVELLSVTETGAWRDLEAREIRIRLTVSADSPLREVKLFFGQRLLRCLRPGTNALEYTTAFVSNESRDVYLQIMDTDARTAFSKALPAHRVLYHHFIGSDRMNGYCWVAEPSAPEVAHAKPEGKWARLLGSLYPRLGWGETIAFVAPRQMDRPLGLETGTPEGGVKTIRISPQLRLRDTVEFPAAAPQRTFPLDSTDCVIIEDAITHGLAYEDQDGYKAKRTVEGRFLHSTVQTTIFRWHTAPMLLLESSVEFGRDVPADARQSQRLTLSLLRIACNALTEHYQHTLHLGRDSRQPQTGSVLVPNPTELPEGGYVTVQSHPFGVPAVFTFEPASYTIHEEFGAPVLSVGDQLRGRLPEAGDRLERQLLFVLTPGGERDTDLVASIHDLYGFDGTPSYRITTERGSVRSTRFAPVLVAERHAVVCRITSPDLPNPLGLRVHGLNPNWDAALFDLERKTLKRFATHAGIGYIALNTPCAVHCVLGNLVVADSPDVVINVLALRPEGGALVVHNPRAEPVETRLSCAADIPGVPRLETRVTIPGGAEVSVAWP